MDSTQPRFIIYGAGAIGATIGVVLHRAGHDVVLIARGAHFRALETFGLTFTHGEQTSVLAIPVVDDPRRIPIGPGDVVILAMKSQDTEAALVTLGGHASTATAVVCAQNGVANEPAALRRFPNVHGMCVLCPATHLAPGEVIAHSAPIVGNFDIGRYPAGVDGVDELVASALTGSSAASLARADVMAWKYAKLVRNLGNALEALFPPSPERAEIGEAARSEAETCLAAAQIDVIEADVFATNQRRIRTQAPAAAVAGVQPLRGGGSTWQSLARGAGSVETDYLNGEIVLLGRLHGIATPVNALLQRLMTEAAQEGQKPASSDVARFNEELALESGSLR
jgi:2-dehydropantoate 2-reductase